MKLQWLEDSTYVTFVNFTHTIKCVISIMRLDWESATGMRGR